MATAKSALQVACIQEEQGKCNEAYHFSKLAARTFEAEFGQGVDMTITAKWQMLALAFKLKKEDVIDQAVNLYQSLVKRDNYFSDRDQAIETLNTAD